MKQPGLGWVMALLLSVVQSAWALDYQQLTERTDHPVQLAGQFRQVKYLALLEASIASSGRFSYRRGEEIRWLTEQPVASEMLMTPHGISSRQNGQELMHLDAAEQPMARVMSDIFFAVLTADWQALENYFVLDGVMTEQGWQIELTPRGAEMAAVVSRVALSGDRLLQRVVLEEASGDHTEIIFDEFEF